MDGDVVLVVDDDDDIREALRDLLETEGYRVVCADNGREALDALRGGVHPCIILLDLMMPVMDGWQFRTEQKRDPKLAKIPVVAITAAADPSSIDVEVIMKPVDVQSVLGALEKYC